MNRCHVHNCRAETGPEALCVVHKALIPPQFHAIIGTETHLQQNNLRAAVREVLALEEAAPWN